MKVGKGSRMLKTVATFYIILFLCVLSVLPIAVCPLAPKQLSDGEYISAESMQAYALTLIGEYTREVGGYYPTIPINLPFNQTISYSIRFYNSSQGGAALWFEPASSQSFQIVSTTERIETAVFGGNLSLGGFFAGTDVTKVMFSNARLVNWGNRPFLKLSGECEVIVENVSISRDSLPQVYHLVVIKTNNVTSDWTIEIAKAEASYILLEDTGISFPITPEFGRLYAEPVLTLLLEDIKNRLNDPAYTLSQYLADLKNVQKIATENGITSEYLNEIIAFINAKTTGVLPFPSSPTETTFRILLWKFDDPTNGWMFIGFICFFSLLSLVFYIVFDEAKEKHPSRSAKGLLQLPLWASALIVVMLLTTPPENWQPTPVQGAFILIAIVIILIAALFELKKYKKNSAITASSATFADKPKGKTKSNSDKQPKHSFETKKPNEDSTKSN